MKKLIIVIIIFINLNVLFSQNDGLYLSKYWNYRYALKGDQVDPSYGRWEPGFVEVGEGQGYSLPMRYRTRTFAKNEVINPSNPQPWPYKKGDFVNTFFWEILNGLPLNRKPVIGGSLNYGALNWGDAPDLGKYMIVLATELGLLLEDAKRYNKSNLFDIVYVNSNLYHQLVTTYFELNYALDAFNRLDNFAEITYGNSASPDGFFVRDDVPSNFNDDCKFGCAQDKFTSPLAFIDPINSNSTYYKGNNFYASLSGHVSGQEMGKYDCGTNTNFDPWHCAMSQDVFYRYMLGVIYAKVFLEKMKAAQGDPYNYSHKAHEIIDRSFWKWFPNYNMFLPNGAFVQCGGNAIGYSDPIYSIYQRYGDGNTQGGALANAAFQGIPLWLGQKTALTVGFTNALLLGSTILPGNPPAFPGNYHSWEMYGNLCVMDDRSPMFFFPNNLKLFGDELARFGPKKYDYNINNLLELLRHELHGGGGLSFSIGTSGISASLRYMPVAELYSFLNKSYFSDCEHDTRSYEEGGEVYAEQNGLDYMIAHNLYLLQKDREDRIDVSNNHLASYVPMYDREIDMTYPATRSYNCKLLSPPNTWPPITNVHSTFITYGSKTNPLIIEAANSITARKAVFNSDAKVDIIAPHTDLLPGFHAVYGSVCTVYNERLKCTSYITNNSCGIGLKSAVISDDIKQEKPTSISLYPNPTSENTSIKLSNYNNLTVKIGIYDMIGKLKSREYIAEVANNEDEKDINLDTESLPVGIYIVKVSHGDTYTSVKLEKR